jgi:hypothetical protein
MIDLDELERMEQAATARPWEVQLGDRFGETDMLIKAPEDPDPEGIEVVVRSENPFDYFDPCDKNNFDLIVALRNAAPEIIARIRQLEARVADLEQSYAEEIDQFNAGFDAARAGESDEYQPHFEHDHDTWGIGYAWEKFEKLNGRVRELEAYIVQANKLLVDIDKERLALRTALITERGMSEAEVDTIASNALEGFIDDTEAPEVASWHEQLVARLRGVPRMERDEAYIEDGFGGRWSATCPRCGAPMQVVRPGDCRCSAECYIGEEELESEP